MLYDGTNRVYVAGEKNSGRKTLISSIMHQFAFNAVWSDGNQWELSPMGKNAEMLEGAQLLEKKMTALDRIRVFDIEKITADSGCKVPDFADLGLFINNEVCGRIYFTNITGKQEDMKILSEYMFSIILIVADCNEILRNNTEYIGRLSAKLEKAVNACGEKPRVVFALTKADMIPEDMKNNDFAQLYQLFEKNAQELVSYCMKNAIIHEKRAVCALNKSTHEIFAKDGSLLSEPNFQPWEVDRLLVDIISLSVPLTRMRLGNIIDRCNDIRMRRRGVFSLESIRAQLVLRMARKNLCTTIRNICPLDNAMKYIGR